MEMRRNTAEFKWTCLKPHNSILLCLSACCLENDFKQHLITLVLVNAVKMEPVAVP